MLSPFGHMSRLPYLGYTVAFAICFFVATIVGYIDAAPEHIGLIPLAAAFWLFLTSNLRRLNDAGIWRITILIPFILAPLMCYYGVETYESRMDQRVAEMTPGARAAAAVSIVLPIAMAMGEFSRSLERGYYFFVACLGIWCLLLLMLTSRPDIVTTIEDKVYRL